MSEKIEVSKNVRFDTDSCRFHLTSEASETIYRKKGVICSYSGASEWVHDFTCDMLDLYSGSTPYNYALGCYCHKERFPALVKAGEAEKVVKFVKSTVENETFKKMYANIDRIIDDLDEV